MRKATKSIDLISKKQICMCSTLFLYKPLLFCMTHCCFARLKRITSQLHIIFMEELLYLLTKNFAACVPIPFFFTPVHFHLAGCRHFSCLSQPLSNFCFSSNEICLLCFKSLALAIHWYAYDVEGQSHGYTAM